jgi:hypothetical protein
MTAPYTRKKVEMDKDKQEKCKEEKCCNKEWLCEICPCYKKGKQEARAEVLKEVEKMIDEWTSNLKIFDKAQLINIPDIEELKHQLKILEEKK